MGQTSDNTHSSPDTSTEMVIVVDKPHRPLATGWAKAQVIHELAVGEVTQKELAERFGVTQGSIAQFKKRNMPLIEARQEKLADEYAWLWIADKGARLGALQDAAEGLIGMELTPTTASTLSRLLKDAKEELEPLGNKNNINIQLATYELANIDIADI